MANNQIELTGSNRAAIFLMSLKEREATEVLKHLPVAQVQKIGQAMATLAKVSREEADDVLSNFTLVVESEAPLTGRSPQFLKRLLSGSLGEDEANTLLERLAEDSPSGLDSLQLMESKQVAELIRQEHPQVMAIVLAGLETKKSAEIIAELPTRIASDIIERIATLEEVPQHAIQELDDVLRERSSESTGFKVQTMGGIRSAAEILNATRKESGKKILDDLDEREAELSEEIQDNMIIFENLKMLDDRGVQALLREITSETLILALKGAEDVMKDKIFNNMSKRAAELLRDDLEAKGPVRVSEVEDAQKEIVGVARRLADEGTLQLGSGSDDFV